MMKIYLFSIVLGFFSIIVTAIYFRFRNGLPKKGIEEYIETFKWIAWFTICLLFPLFFMEELLKFIQLPSSKLNRNTILYIWLIMLFSFFFYTCISNWLKGNLKITGFEGKIIYEGRKRKENN